MDTIQNLSWFFLNLFQKDIQEEKIRNCTWTNQWSAVLQPYSLNLHGSETGDSMGLFFSAS